MASGNPIFAPMSSKSMRQSVRTIENLEEAARSIQVVRGQSVILGTDLASVYSVTTKALNQAVRRNIKRFPPDFAFRLTRKEAAGLQRSRSQNVTLKRGDNIKYAPIAFTEHGAVMAATILKSDRAAFMSVYVVRAVLRLRAWAVGQAELARRLSALDQRVGAHDQELKVIIATIRQLVAVPEPPRRRIGFHTPDRVESRGR
jgi:hypothetical protein